MEELKYTQKQADTLVKLAITEQVEIARKNALVKQVFGNESYYLTNLRENKEVIKLKNVLGIDYHLKEFIPLIDDIGFERFNELVIAGIDYYADDE